jgi:hypothetical protein
MVPLVVLEQTRRDGSVYSQYILTYITSDFSDNGYDCAMSFNYYAVEMIILEWGAKILIAHGDRSSHRTAIRCINMFMSPHPSDPRDKIPCTGRFQRLGSCVRLCKPHSVWLASRRAYAHLHEMAVKGQDVRCCQMQERVSCRYPFCFRPSCLQ